MGLYQVLSFNCGNFFPSIFEWVLLDTAPNHPPLSLSLSLTDASFKAPFLFHSPANGWLPRQTMRTQYSLPLFPADSSSPGKLDDDEPTTDEEQTLNLIWLLEQPDRKDPPFSATYSLSSLPRWGDAGGGGEGSSFISRNGQASQPKSRLAAYIWTQLCWRSQ